MIYLLLPVVWGLVWWFYRNTMPSISPKQRYLLLHLRWISLSLVMMMLMNPVLSFVHKVTHRPTVLFLQDTSRSMDIEMHGKNKTQVLKPWKEHLGEQFHRAGFKVVSEDFADGYHGKNNSTNLTSTLMELSRLGKLKDISKIVLLSDGWLKDEQLDMVNDLNVPIYTIKTSEVSDSMDLQIVAIHHNRTAYKNEPTPVTVEVEASQFKGKATVSLEIKGKSVATKNIDFSTSSQNSVSFEPSFSEVGLQQIQIKVVMQQQRERNTDNNIYPSAIQVLNDRDKILLLGDVASWDLKAIQETIKNNKRWDTDALIVRDNQLWAGSKLVTLQQLSTGNYLAVVIINAGTLSLPAQVKTYLTNGLQRGLGIWLLGPPVQNDPDIQPARPSNLTNLYKAGFHLTSAANAFAFAAINDKVQDDIPPVQYAYVTAKPGSHVIATMKNDQNSPAMLVQQMGKGKVLQFTFLDFWKWQLWSKNDEYPLYVQNILLWLTNQNQSNFMVISPKNSYFLGERISFQLEAVDDKQMPITDMDARITVFNDTQKPVFTDFFIMQDDTYQIQLPTLREGHYSYVVQEQKLGLSTKGEFMVSGVNLEQKDIGFNDPVLQYLAHSTNGLFLDAHQISTFRPLPENPHTEKTRVEIPLYRKWYIITLFLLAFGLELLLRRLWGLL